MRAAPDMSQVYTDFAGLTALKSKAREDQGAALDQVTRQFESLFLQMMLKSMRDASFGGGLLDSKQSGFYRDMYDQQLSIHLSEHGGIGLADVLKRQLGGEALPAAEGMDLADYRLRSIPLAPPVGAAPGEEPATGDALSIGSSPETFVQALWPAAEKAGAELGLPPEALLAQAALESGWGRHVMQDGAGRSAHNLFGIKADARWDGPTVNRQTLEYVDGLPVRTRARFRAYASYEQSFSDYVDFVRNSPRYRAAVEAGDAQAYFRELQKAGYATDPAYADKVNSIINGPEMQSASAAMQGPYTGGSGKG